MKLKEIIDSLLDQAQDRDSFIDDADPECIFRHDAAALRAAVELLQKAYTANEPLTLDELRQMDGEPVFIEYIRENLPGKWKIVLHVTDRQIDFTDKTSLYIPDSSPAVPCYGRTWHAYRRKPEVASP